MPPQMVDTRINSEPGVVPSPRTSQAKVRHGHPPHNESKQMQYIHTHYLSTQEQHGTMLEAYIRWLTCLGGCGRRIHRTDALSLSEKIRRDRRYSGEA